LTTTVLAIRDELAGKTSENVQLRFDLVTCQSDKSNVEEDLAQCQLALSTGTQATDPFNGKEPETCGDFQDTIMALRSRGYVMQETIANLEAEVTRFQEIENINEGCQNLATTLEGQADSVASWQNAVDNGGLSCSFVPREICSLIASCMVQDARCVNL
jgi:hypothetical protein